MPPMAGAPGMPGMPGMGGGMSNALDKRLQDMERKVQEQEEAKKRLEEKAKELEYQLKEEHEKVILQSLKAKEEETLSVKVEQQLREMQEKLRREKYEQELQESRGKAENQLKDMERRIGEERETWMTALKNQLKEREVIEQEVEQTLTRRLRDFEQRYQEEKNQWTLSTRQKEEELNQQRRRFELEIEKLEETIEDQEEKLSDVKESTARERHTSDMQHQAEFRALQAQCENQMRETGSWKAQVALVQAQLQQLEVQNQQERNRAESQIQQDRVRTESQIRQREEELKREFSQRDNERTAYWEGLLTQLKADKESLRQSAVRHEEETARIQVEISDLKRKYEVERNEWQAGMERTRRLAKEEALRDLPQVYEDRLKTLQQQLVKAGENQKAMHAKFDIEQKRWEQQRANLVQAQQELEKDRAQLLSESQRLKTDFEKQAKEMLHHIAASQTKESNVREEMNNQKKMMQEQLDIAKAEKEKLDAVIATSLRQEYNQESQIKRFEEETERLKSQCDQLMRQVQENRAKEELWKTSQGQLTAAFHNLQAELVKLQNDHVQREKAWMEKERIWADKEALSSEKEKQLADVAMKWAEKEKQWTDAQAVWEKMKVELENAKAQAQAAPAAPAPATLSVEAQKALSGIKQQMQELRTVFASLRPAA
jgi:chromosome segregation ATPase